MVITAAITAPINIIFDEFILQSIRSQLFDCSMSPEALQSIGLITVTWLAYAIITLRSLRAKD